MNRSAPFLLISVGLALFAAAACGDGPDEAASDATATTTSEESGTPVVLQNATTTATGLQYVDEVIGTGATPAMTSSVTVHYVGRLAANGLVFDSSVASGQPATFQMSRVIPGFREALSTMKEGGRRTALLPSALGYGPGGFPPDIPPDADLVFEIELISVQ